MKTDLLFGILLAAPTAAGLLSAAMPSIRSAFRMMTFGIGFSVFTGLWAVHRALEQGPLLNRSGWFLLDALSAFHLLLMLAVFLFCTLYAWIYFGAEKRSGRLTLKQARLFCALWCSADAAMTLVLVSNNIGMLWVGIEATTLFTAFLIAIHVTRESLEAMWRYILLCSVGVAFAFMGTLLTAASARGLGLDIHQILLWTTLRDHAAQLHPMLIKASFIFLLIGYGTKAGLAPMHNWLPDAHSQAPAPVSALFSGFMLSTAMYCLMRFRPVVEGATGNAGWSSGLFLPLGLLSIILAAGFILFQKNVKRFLAYSSMEHIGIIAFALGAGGPGLFAALFHTLNHSLAKVLSFSAAGSLGQSAGGFEMKKLYGSAVSSPGRGIGLFAGILALIGTAPFSVFFSEFLVLRAAMQNVPAVFIVLFLVGIGTVFIGALNHAIGLAWGKPDSEPKGEAVRLHETLLFALPVALLILFGIWLPAPLRSLIEQAAAIMGADTGWIP